MWRVWVRRGGCIGSCWGNRREGDHWGDLGVEFFYPRYRPCVAQRAGRGIALLFHDCRTRRGWVVSSTPRPHFIPGKDPVPILQEAGWAPGPVWTGGISRPHRDTISDRPACSQSLYRLRGVDGWIILVWISSRWDVGIWTGLGWPRIETGGGRLWVR